MKDFIFTLPKRLHEANIQAEFYLRCKQESIPCLLEYKVKGARFDAIIYKDKKLICLVEVKNLTERAIRRRLSSKREYKQTTKYEKFGYPLLFVWDTDYIEPVICHIKTLVHKAKKGEMI